MRLFTLEFHEECLLLKSPDMTVMPEGFRDRILLMSCMLMVLEDGT